MTKAKDMSCSRLRKSKAREKRYIKVHEMHYEYRVKEQSPYSPCRSVPWINIKGHWLRIAGFNINTPVKSVSWMGAWY